MNNKQITLTIPSSNFLNSQNINYFYRIEKDYPLFIKDQDGNIVYAGFLEEQRVDAIIAYLKFEFPTPKNLKDDELRGVYTKNEVFSIQNGEKVDYYIFPCHRIYYNLVDDNNLTGITRCFALGRLNEYLNGYIAGMRMESTKTKDNKNQISRHFIGNSLTDNYYNGNMEDLYYFGYGIVVHPGHYTTNGNDEQITRYAKNNDSREDIWYNDRDYIYIHNKEDTEINEEKFNTFFNLYQDNHYRTLDWFKLYKPAFYIERSI